MENGKITIDTMFTEDISLYYPCPTYHGNRLVYECMEYSFVGSMQSYTDPRHAVKFIKSCFLTEKECEEKCRELNAGKKKRNEMMRRFFKKRFLAMV